MRVRRFRLRALRLGFLLSKLWVLSTPALRSQIAGVHVDLNSETSKPENTVPTLPAPSQINPKAQTLFYSPLHIRADLRSTKDSPSCQMAR